MDTSEHGMDSQPGAYDRKRLLTLVLSSAGWLWRVCLGSVRALKKGARCQGIGCWKVNRVADEGRRTCLNDQPSC